MATEIAIILDRSGSMASRHDDMEGGLNAFLKEQKEDRSDDAFLSLFQFDHEFEIVHNNVPISTVDQIKLRPRGSTALIDAIGYAVTMMKERKRRPEDKVVIMVVTDGYENASKDWKTDAVRELVKGCEEDLKFQFLYLGADIDAFSDSSALGFNYGQTMSASSAKFVNTMSTTARNVSNYRSGVSGQSVTSYTDQEREEAVEEK